MSLFSETTPFYASNKGVWTSSNKSIATVDNGTVTFNWNNGTQDTIFENIIQWINSVNLASDGTLTVTYNTPDTNNTQ